MRPAIHMLGALSPTIQEEFEGQLGALEALQQQSLEDIILVGRAGADVSGYQARHDLLTNTIIELRARIQTMDDAGAAAWRTEAAAVHASFMTLLNELGARRVKLAESARLTGLWWGLGVAAVVGGVGWGVWRQRKGRRR